MGPSGCGKTTLLNCLSGLDTIDGGEILIDGVDARRDVRQRAHRLPRAPMGFVFQFYNLLPVLTAVENVELPLLVARRPAKEARERALAALDLVGLARPRRARPRRALRRPAPARRRSRARSSTTRRSSGPTSPPATSTARTPTRSST